MSRCSTLPKWRTAGTRPAPPISASCWPTASATSCAAKKPRICGPWKLFAHLYSRSIPGRAGTRPQSLGRDIASTSFVVALFIAQRLCRIDSCNSQSWHSGSNERYRCEGQDDSEDCGHIVDAYAIEHAVHHSQRSRTKEQSQKKAQYRGARAGAADLHHCLTHGRAQGHADANLARPLRHHVGNQRENADRAQQQSQGRHCAQQRHLDTLCRQGLREQVTHTVEAREG